MKLREFSWRPGVGIDAAALARLSDHFPMFASRTVGFLMFLALLAGCASAPRLQVVSQDAPGSYSGPPLDPLRAAIPAADLPADESGLDLLRVFERTHGIDHDAILRASFDRIFGSKARAVPRGSKWVLRLETIGLESPDPYSMQLKPTLLLTLRVRDRKGRDGWHAREGIRGDHPATPAFTLEELRDSPPRLAAAWTTAVDICMQRLLTKYRAGVRDRREGYAE